MDRVPIGMIRCPQVGVVHEAAICLDPDCGHPFHRLEDRTHLRCVECDATLKMMDIYVPEKGDTVSLYLSQLLILEESEPDDLAPLVDPGRDGQDARVAAATSGNR